jgi:hypothetical protein
MSICIICREEKDEFSDEHVIPDAMGGCYHIYNVCKGCNSIMGDKVDSKLVNHMFSKYSRFLYKLEGKTGEIPNPFDGTHHLENDTTIKFKLIPDENSVITPYMLPSTSEEKIDEYKYRINISVDDKDIDKIDNILNKKLKRLGLNSSQIVARDTTQTAKKGLTVETHSYFDLVEFKIGLLKIAYEFAVSNIEDYFYDKMAVEISNVLKNALYNQVTKYMNGGDGFTKDILKPFSSYLAFESAKHYLILFDVDGKLYCLLSIFNIFVIGIQLSETSYLSGIDTIIGINDYINKKFTIQRFLDILNKSTNYSCSYVLNFKSREDNLEFIVRSKKGKLPFYSNENGLLLFDLSGENILADEVSLIEDYFKRNPAENDGIHTEIPVPDECYLKMKPDNKMVKLTKIIEERITSKV